MRGKPRSYLWSSNFIRAELGTGTNSSLYFARLFYLAQGRSTFTVFKPAAFTNYVARLFGSNLPLFSILNSGKFVVDTLAQQYTPEQFFLAHTLNASFTKAGLIQFFDHLELKSRPFTTETVRSFAQDYPSCLLRPAYGTTQEPGRAMTAHRTGTNARCWKS